MITATNKGMAVDTREEKKESEWIPSCVSLDFPVRLVEATSGAMR